MKSITHSAHSRDQRHGTHVMAALPVETDPACQQMLYRLGMAVGGINASGINRVTYVAQVAGTIQKLKEARA